MPPSCLVPVGTSAIWDRIDAINRIDQMGFKH